MLSYDFFFFISFSHFLFHFPFKEAQVAYYSCLWPLEQEDIGSAETSGHSFLPFFLISIFPTVKFLTTADSGLQLLGHPKQVELTTLRTLHFYRRSTSVVKTSRIRSYTMRWFSRFQGNLEVLASSKLARCWPTTTTWQLINPSEDIQEVRISSHSRRSTYLLLSTTGTTRCSRNKRESGPCSIGRSFMCNRRLHYSTCKW